MSPDIDRLLDYWHERQTDADRTEYAVDVTDADAARRAIHDAIAARCAVGEKARGEMGEIVNSIKVETRLAINGVIFMPEQGAPRAGVDEALRILRHLVDASGIPLYPLIDKAKGAAERAGGAS